MPAVVCPSCSRFCRTRRRYGERLSRCCHQPVDPPERGPVVVEIVRELEIGGERFAVAVTRQNVPLSRVRAAAEKS